MSSALEAKSEELAEEISDTLAQLQKLRKSALAKSPAAKDKNGNHSSKKMNDKKVEQVSTIAKDATKQKKPEKVNFILANKLSVRNASLSRKRANLKTNAAAISKSKSPKAIMDNKSQTPSDEKVKERINKLIDKVSTLSIRPCGERSENCPFHNGVKFGGERVVEEMDVARALSRIKIPRKLLKVWKIRDSFGGGMKEFPRKSATASKQEFLSHFSKLVNFA